MVETLPFGEQYLEGSFAPPIRHADVRRLALEGGGGKGNAYLGALFALEQLGILERLQTVAGSSAGAITSMALSLGMRPGEVFDFMANTDFGRFFDQPSDVRPRVGQPYEHTPPADRAKRRLVQSAWTYEVSSLHTIGRIFLGLRKARSGLSTGALQAQLLKLFAPRDVRLALIALQYSRRAAQAPPEPLTNRVIDQLVTSLPDYLTSLSQDTGIFSGESARDTLADLIAARIGLRHADPAARRSQASARVDGRTVTFAQLDDFCSTFGYPLLRVTGSEICSLRSVIFSGATTPSFPVADAVRISMGLPLVYKPYWLRQDGSGQPPCGVYVDGGVFSNLPLLAYSDEEARSTVGLRLEIDAATPIEGTLGFLGQIAKASMLAGESNVVADRAARSVRLDTQPLGLFDFTAERQVLETVARRAHLTTMLFFGQGAAFAPVDIGTGLPLQGQAAADAKDAAWKDLRESIARRRAVGGCVFKETSDRSHPTGRTG